MTDTDRPTCLTCLTVLQPWIFGILDGRKTVENRSWRCTMRGRLWLHSGKSRVALDRFPDGSPIPWDALVYGAILGCVDVVDCVPASECAGDPWAAKSGWCWRLANPRALAVPVVARGVQRLWTIPADVAAKLVLSD